MTDERFNRWLENVVRWYHAANLRTVLAIEWIADTQYAFLIVALLAVAAGVLLITFTTWMVKG